MLVLMLEYASAHLPGVLESSHSQLTDEAPQIHTRKSIPQEVAGSPAKVTHRVSEAQDPSKQFDLTDGKEVILSF